MSKCQNIMSKIVFFQIFARKQRTINVSRNNKFQNKIKKKSSKWISPHFSGNWWTASQQVFFRNKQAARSFRILQKTLSQAIFYEIKNSLEITLNKNDGLLLPLSIKLLSIPNVAFLNWKKKESTLKAANKWAKLEI